MRLTSEQAERHIASLRLNSSEQQELEGAIARGFVIQQGTGKRQWCASNAYMIWCEGNGRVYVRVSPKVRFAEVFLDVVNQHVQFTGAVIDELMALLDAHTPTRAWVVGSSGACYSQKVRIQDADSVAAKAFAIVSRAGSLCSRTDGDA